MFCVCDSNHLIILKRVAVKREVLSGYRGRGGAEGFHVKIPMYKMLLASARIDCFDYSPSFCRI